MFDLDRTQRWMQAVIMHPDGVVPGVHTPAALTQMELTPEDLESVVTRSKAMTGLERLAIYSRSYHARLTECLQAEFAVLRHALGEELFDLFARSYLSNCPSRSFTLANLGKDFPGFLDSTRPGSEPTDGDDDDESWQHFILDLARLERAFNEVFDGPGVEGQQLLTGEQVRELSLDSDSDYQVRLVPTVCLRLLKFHYPVHDYFDAVRHERQPEIPAPVDTLVVMHRRDFVVRMLGISASQHELLGALMEGDTVGQALQRVGASSSEHRKQLVDDLTDWADRGFFLATQTDCQQMV